MKNLSRNLALVAFSTFVVGVFLVTLAPGSWAAGAASSGMSTYSQKCAMCHGKDGRGNTPVGKSMKVPDLRSKTVQKQSDTQLYDTIAKGKGKMPGYSHQLSKAQIHGLVTYIRALAKK